MAELEELAPLLADFETTATQTAFSTTHLPQPLLHVLHFDAKAHNTRREVRIPQTGEFKLIIEAGEQARLLDGDARDGEARLQLPAGTFETLFHLQGGFLKNSRLEVEDPLYYVQDDLNSQKGRLFRKERWFRLGLRPVPVPTDWYGPDGNRFVLHFKAQKVNEFQMIWRQKEVDAPIPPSVQVVPRVDCIQNNLNGSYTAYLGYTNLMPGPVDLPLGTANHFSPKPSDRGQLTHFETGSSPTYPDSVQPLVFTEDHIRWELNGRQVDIDATDENLSCQQSQPEITVAQDTAVRKSFLPLQTYQIESGNSAHFDLPFTVAESSDLKRRIIVNLNNGNPDGSGRVSHAEVKINGQTLSPHLAQNEQNLVNKNTSGMGVSSNWCKPAERLINIC